MELPRRQKVEVKEAQLGRSSFPYDRGRLPLANGATPPYSHFPFGEKEGSSHDGEGSTSRPTPHSLNGKGSSIDLSP
ncbi:hypothetical protein ACOSP7_015009 [Xanthoceras sorbifolium]